MRMISGSILVLVASVLVAAQWIGRVMAAPTIVGASEAGRVTLMIAVLALVGAAAIVWGVIADPRPPTGPS